MVMLNKTGRSAGRSSKARPVQIQVQVAISLAVASQTGQKHHDVYNIQLLQKPYKNSMLSLRFSSPTTVIKICIFLYPHPHPTTAQQNPKIRTSYVSAILTMLNFPRVCCFMASLYLAAPPVAVLGGRTLPYFVHYIESEVFCGQNTYWSKEFGRVVCAQFCCLCELPKNRMNWGLKILNNVSATRTLILLELLARPALLEQAMATLLLHGLSTVCRCCCLDF